MIAAIKSHFEKLPLALMIFFFSKVAINFSLTSAQPQRINLTCSLPTFFLRGHKNSKTEIVNCIETESDQKLGWFGFKNFYFAFVEQIPWGGSHQDPFLSEVQEGKN